MVDIASPKGWLPPLGWAWLFEAAKQYNLSYGQVRRHVKRGRIQARKRGMRWQEDIS